MCYNRDDCPSVPGARVAGPRMAQPEGSVVHTIETLALHVRGDSTTGFYLEAVARGKGLTGHLVREYYGPLSRSELYDVAGAVLEGLRPGCGFFDGGAGSQWQFDESL